MKHLHQLVTRAVYTLSTICLLSLLSACSQQNIRTVQIDSSTPPDAAKFSADVQLLAPHQQPDWRTQGYGYLLLGDSLKTDTSPARQSCQALFSEAKLYDSPTIASDPQTPVTYMVVGASQDYARASARYKWSTCSRLTTTVDGRRELALLKTFGLLAEDGPWLVHVPQAYRNQQIPKSAIALSLKGQSADLVHQWKQALRQSPQLGKQPGDVEILTLALDLKATKTPVISYFDHHAATPRLTQR